MKTLGRLLIVLLLAGNILFMAALSMHVVRAPGKFAFAAKSQLTLIDAYVDTTNWSGVELADHPMLVSSLTHAGKMDVLSHITSVTLVPSSRHEWNTTAHTDRQMQKTAAPEEPRQKSIFDVPGQK